MDASPPPSSAEIRAEVCKIKERQDALDAEAMAIGPIWLHPAMTDADARTLLDQKMAANPDVWLMQTAFLIHGPHYSPEFDSQPDEVVATPAGAMWYRVHMMRLASAPNQEAPHENIEDMQDFRWTIMYDDDDVAIAAGYYCTHSDTVYDDIIDLGSQEYGDRTQYVPVENVERLRGITTLRAELAALIARSAELTAAASTSVNVLIIKGNSHLTSNYIGTVEVPAHIDGELVSNFIAERVSTISEDTLIMDPNRARVFLIDGSTPKMVLTDTLYDEFKTMLSRTESEIPLLQIIEYDRKRFRAEAAARKLEDEDEPSDRKRRRVVVDLTGAAAIYDIGHDISPDDPRELTVWMLANRGLVVVDAATGDAACDHIFEDGVAAFCAEQSEHGYACYQCHTDTVQ